MKKLLLVLAVAFALSACAGIGPRPGSNNSLPIIGMTEQALIDMWGRGGNSSYYVDSGITTTWYTKTLLGVIGGYHQGNPFYFNTYLIYIQNGKVVDWSIH